jgi:hypothetical protein
MTNLQLLRQKLHIHNRDCSLIPAYSETEQKQRDLQEKLILLQLECEEWREQIKLCFKLCRTKEVVEKINDLEVVKYRTEFRWEPLRDKLMEHITLKELAGIEYLTTLYEKTKNEQQEKV